MSDSSVVTCTACRLRIVGTAERHEHYRCDLHRVNLKRKVGGLGPLTLEEFHVRLAALQPSDQDSKTREAIFCNVCSKKFSSQKALDNHVKSRRHIDRLRSMGDADGGSSVFSALGTSDVEEGESVDMIEDDDAVERELERRIAEGGDLGVLDCVFDGSAHASVEENLAYMGRRFGFFLPFVEELVDAEGLLKYLGQKVGIGYACVSCDKAFGSVEAVQMHMVDRGHCRMAGDSWEEEFGEFYQFDEQGWEEVDNGNEGDGEEGLVGEEEVGLVVAGKVLGHRSLRRYYKQSAGSNADSRVAVVANRVMKEYRLLGWEGKKMDVSVKRMEKRRIRNEKRFNLMVGIQNYYTRKATFKQKMAVFNSGYRA